MGKGSKAPKPPDPHETVAAEAQFNRVDTYSPSGSGTRLRLYEYRNLWDAPGTVRRGYMAQDVLGWFPWAVHFIGGVLALDYSKLPPIAKGGA